MHAHVQRAVAPHSRDRDLPPVVRRRLRIPHVPRGVGSDDRLLVRTGWRLGILTSLMLSGLVIGLGLAAYAEARSALLEPLKSLVSTTAHQEAAFELGDRDVEPVHAGVFVYHIDAHGRVRLGSPHGPRGRSVPSVLAARRALRSGRPSYETIRTGSGSYLVYTLPLRHGHTERAVQTAASTAQYDASLGAVTSILLITGGLGLVATMIISALLVWRALVPIRVSMQRQRDFVADAAHELRTPLTIIRSAAEAGIEQGRGAEPQRAEVTLKQTLHLTRLVSDLSLLARADSGALEMAHEPLDMGRLVTEIVGDLELVGEDAGVTLSISVAGDARVTGDAGRLRQVVLILADNALRHSPRGGTVSMRVDRSRKEVVLRVEDEGPGIAADDLEHIFDRFYRPRATRNREGAGLGLSIAAAIARSHSGRISAQNRTAGGASFTVFLPHAG